MLNFYLIVLALSGSYLTVQLAAYLFYGKVFFRNTGILFEEKKNRFEWQMVFPKNLLLLVICVFSSSFFGLIMTGAGVTDWITLPLAVMGGLAVNFIINAVIMPRIDKRSDSGQPTDAELDGADAVVLTEITAEDYGRIEVIHGKRRYIFDALTANGNTLREGEKVIVIHAEDGLCFVEAQSRLFDVLFTEDTPPVTEQTQQEPPRLQRDTIDIHKDEQ